MATTKGDGRYSVAPEFGGYPDGRHYVVRFCGDFIGESRDEAEARGIADAHNAARMAPKCATVGYMHGTIDSEVIPDATAAGLSYRVAVEADLDSRPDDFGLYPESCYTQKQFEAWQQDRWSFVTVVITPMVEGFDLSAFETSIGGVEYGSFPMTNDKDDVLAVEELDLERLTKSHAADRIEELRGQLKAKLGAMSYTLRAVASQLPD
jgi:hypothetical protein